MATTVINAIIGRFSYDYSYEVIERVMEKRPFAHCGIISSGPEPRYFTKLPKEKQDWFISSEIRGCEYGDIDWTTLRPLDEELIEGMRDCEAVFMEIVTRLEWKRQISYDTRKRWYHRHLRFWNDYIHRHSINFYVSAWMPHEIPDIVIYYLCKHYNIPVLYFECASMVKDTSFAEHDWKESAYKIPAVYEALLRQYANVKDPSEIPLDAEYEKRYQALTTVEGVRPPAHVNLPSYWKKIQRKLFEAPVSLVKNVFQYATPQGIRRLSQTIERRRVFHERNAFYDAHAVDPDLTKKFVYQPLHYQPEASTTPMSGVYVNQVLMAQLLDASLPDDVLIYVKEHPWESGWLMRDIAYYEALLAIPKVRLLKRSADTFELREHCMAVATGTGTAGVEALFRGKPTFLFGHRFYQYAHGVYMIHSLDDCKKAAHAIFIEGKTPTLIESRIYLKAMEEARVHGAINPWHRDVSELPDEQHISSHVTALLEELDHFFA